MTSDTSIKVWDPLVRVFHWLLAAGFFVAYFSEDDFQQVHHIAGYLITSLVIGRILWGFIGSKHAQFKNFVVDPTTVIAYLKGMIKGDHPRYLGHNPAGALTIFLLLGSILCIAFTGMTILAIEEQAGPLAGWIQTMGWTDDDVFEELHEFFANFTVFLVIFHVSGVLLESMLHKDNLVKSMFTGLKQKNIK